MAGKQRRKKMTIEEKRMYEREKKRKQRARMTDVQKELKKEYDRTYKKKKKEENTWKTVETMSDRELRKVRKQTRIRVQRFRKRKAEREKFLNQLIDNSPPESPQSLPPDRVVPPKRNSGRKKKNLNRSKVYRALKRMELALKIEKAKSQRYKKQAQRLQQRLKTGSSGSPSPNTKVKKLTGGKKVPTPVKRRLVFAESMLSHIEKKSSNSNLDLKKKDELSSLVSSPYLKKYRMINQAEKLVSYKVYRKALMGQNTKRGRKNHPHSHLVKQFLEEDINSKMCPGKRDTRTKKKTKIQKRILLDTMKNLHGRFTKTYPGIKLSYSMFCKLKPFYIVAPKMADRETCACIHHTNFQFVVDKLYQINVLDTNSIRKVMEESCCDVEKKSCMYRKCTSCVTKMTFRLPDEDAKITYKKWIQKKETRTIKGKEKNIRITEKKTEECTIKELVGIFIESLSIMGPHIFQIHYQYKSMKHLKENLTSNEIMIHMDFSENYVIKHAEEIQAMHFGASKRQLSIHTVVVYKEDLPTSSNGEDGVKTKSHQSFATVSSNLDHNAYAVWAHLEPIVSCLQTKHPNVDTVHFRSDGPSSQYKNKNNIYLLMKKLPDIWPGIKKWTWNFSVSGHGKGAMDGIGGTLKRTADGVVLRGNDIIATSDFIQMAKDNCKSIEVFEVQSDKVIEWQGLLAGVKPQVIPGIKKVHQITWSCTKPDIIQLRELPCTSCMFEPCKETCISGQTTIEFNKKKTPNESIPSNEIPEFLETGSYVAVIYDSNWYPGMVLYFYP
jgi:hypothetical protein